MTLRYLIVLEKGDEGYGAYAPDLPGCVAAGPTPEETLRRMRQAIEMHLRGLREDGEAIPEPSAHAEWLTVPTAP